MSDLAQVNANLSALNEKQEEANRIAKDNTTTNNEGTSVLLGLGESIARGEEKASNFIGEKFKGLREGIKGLMPSQEEKGEQRRGFADFLKGLGDKFKGLAGVIGKGFSKGKDAVGGFFAPLVTAPLASRLSFFNNSSTPFKPNPFLSNLSIALKTFFFCFSSNILS